MPTTHPRQHRLQEAQRELQELDRRRQQLLDEIRGLEEEVLPRAESLSKSEKVALFRSFFRGREDVYPRRWEGKGQSGYTPACALEWQRPRCQKPTIRCRDCQHRTLLPVTDKVILWHLQGMSPEDTPGLDGSRPDFTIGVYPLLQDDTTRMLASADHRSLTRLRPPGPVW